MWSRQLPVCGFFLAVLVLSGEAAPPAPLPPINPAAARLDGTIPGLDGPGFALIADEEAGVVAAACEQGTIRYWPKDVIMGVRAGGPTPNVLRSHQGPVLALAWNRRGGLVSAGADQQIILWDWAEAQPRVTIRAGTMIRCLALSPDGRFLAGGGDDQAVHLWDTATGKPVLSDNQPLVWKAHTDWVLCLAFSPDGTLLASGGHDGTVRLWDLATRKKRLEVIVRPPPPTSAAAGPGEPISTVAALAFTLDSKQLVVGNAAAQIYAFAVDDGKFVRAFAAGHTSAVTALVFHPGGTLLVSASKDRTLRLWNPANGQLLKVLEGHTAWVQGAVFLARGTRLASVGADRTVRLWDLTNPKQ